MARPMWVVAIIKKIFPYLKSIAKISKVPLVGKIFDKIVFEGDLAFYLPKDQLISIAQTIDKPDEYVFPSQVIEYFIEKAPFHWIMNFCICRDSSKCKDYPIRFGCLFMGDGVNKINPKLGKLVTKEEALEM